ncbi:MAG: RNA-directed DNA polymerase [Acetobacterium woodii]|nr:RNA-directed DNA polymerase [Acetobacterium woodii]
MFIFDENYFYNIVIKCDRNQLLNIIKEKNLQYESFEIPKNDGMRVISAIKKNSQLVRLQKNLNSNLFSKIPLPVCVRGFVSGESYNSYLVEHIGKKFFLRADISAFFDSIKKDTIISMLNEFISVINVIEQISEVVTLDDKLPQGAITSPSVSNLIFRRIDQRITKYCQELNVTYTRYADDMLFSSDKLNFNESTFFYAMIKKILKENGFACNNKKKKIEIDEISLGGFVISNDVHLSRKKLENINKLIYFFRKDKTFEKQKYLVDSLVFQDKHWLNEVNNLKLKENISFKCFSSNNQLIDYLCGYRAFIISIVQANDNNTENIKQLRKKINNIEMIIEAIIKHST